MIRKYFPWWSKILIKIVLSRLPVSYRIWQKLKIFRHGAMDDPEYAYKTFIRHYNNGNVKAKGDGITVLELGPGDSLASGIISKCLGAEKTYLVDKSTDAVVSTKYYKYLINYLLDKNIFYPEIINENETIEDIKKEWNIDYMTNGLESLKKIPGSSIDYLWSQSVLEHIRLREFRDYVKEFRRIIKGDGISAHGIDLRDHLSYSLNNLRFSEVIWESGFMSNSGFYTNRMRYSEILDIFLQEGFTVEVLNIEKWNNLPIKQKKLDIKFKNISFEEMKISAFDLILTPNNNYY